MSGKAKTSVKRARKPGNGGTVLPDPPKPFTRETQPSPKAKSEGWKKRRAERILTQEILSYVMRDNNLKDYVTNLFKNANKGNAKAIETINRSIEDDVIKISQTDSYGNPVIPINIVLDERYKNNSGNPGIPT
jgi:hypothetical protein